MPDQRYLEMDNSLQLERKAPLDFSLHDGELHFDELDRDVAGRCIANESYREVVDK